MHPTIPTRRDRIKRLAVAAAACAAVGLYIAQQRSARDAVPAPPPGWTVVRPPEVVEAMLAAGDSVWAGGKDGVWRLSASDARVLERIDCGQTVRFVHALLRDAAGTLWIAHNNGLSRAAPDGCATLTARDGLPDTRVNALLLDREGRLWAGTPKGLARRDGEGWTVLTPADGLADEMVNVLLQEPSGSIWAGSFVAPAGGITVMENGSVRTFTLADGLPHAGIAALASDRAGSVWAGVGLANRGGLVKFVRRGGRWTIDRVMRRSDGLPGDKVRSIFQDAAGAMWFGTEMDGLAQFRGGRVFRVLTVKQGMPDNEATSILETPDGALWLGTPSGVVRIGGSALAHAGV